jgi:tRNA A-37 threonylcarbamoyl transferase component Bud32
MIQQLIQGDGLYTTWKKDENWDFMWLTLYHALKSIEQFHNAGYTHGDLHINNFIWTGDRIYIIDFDKITNVSQRLIELEYQKKELKYDDEIDEIDEEIDKLKSYFCDDYSYILSRDRVRNRLGCYEKFNNINKGYERYMMLIDFSKSKSNVCNSKITYQSYAKKILAEYNRIDKLQSTSDLFIEYSLT